MGTFFAGKQFFSVVSARVYEFSYERTAYLQHVPLGKHIEATSADNNERSRLPSASTAPKTYNYWCHQNAVVNDRKLKTSNNIMGLSYRT